MPCTGVLVRNHPRFPDGIFDPLFDPIIFNASTSFGGRLTASGTLTGFDPLYGTAIIPSLNWDLVVPPGPLTGSTPGGLNINMNFMMHGQAPTGVGYSLNPNRPGTPIITRRMTDNSTDATASGTGNLSRVQIDVLPGSTGGGDIWCEIIIYDDNGFSYRAKVRNWPSDPIGCTTPTLGLGSNAPGNIDVIALCYTPNSELYILPALGPTVPLGTGPFFGITPDAITFAFLAAPLATDPAHVMTTTDGLYFYGLTAPGLTGLSLEAVAVGWSAGFISPSNVASITVN